MDDLLCLVQDIERRPGDVDRVDGVVGSRGRVEVDLSSGKIGIGQRSTNERSVVTDGVLQVSHQREIAQLWRYVLFIYILFYILPNKLN